MTKHQWSLAEQRKISQGKCIVKYCRRKPLKGRFKCQTCRLREWSVKNPLRRKYNNLRSGAKRRNIYMDLTYEQFCDLAIKSGYAENSGTTKRKLQIDRIDHNKGYTLNNLQILTCSQNSIKGNVEKAEKNKYKPDLECGF